MSRPTCCGELTDIIAEMESDVRDLVRWGETVFALGTADYDARESLRVVGPAIRAVAERVEKAWERAFQLTNDPKEDDR